MMTAGHRTIAIAGGALVASLWLPWLRVRIGSDWTSVGALELPILPFVLVPLLVVGALTAARALWTRKALDVLLAGTMLAAWAAVPITLITIVRAATAFAPTGLLPRSLQPLLVDTRPDVGLVLAAAAATVALVTLLHETERVDLAEILDLLARRSVGIRAVTAAGLAGALAVWRLRYEPWVVLRGGEREILIEGWALPWIGVGSLLAVLVAIVALAVGLTHARLIAGIVTATAAWLASLLTAAAIGLALLAERIVGEAGELLPSLLARVPVDALAFNGPAPVAVGGVEFDIGLGFGPIGDQVMAAVPEATMTGAPWATFAASLVLAAAGVALARRTEVPA